MSVSWQTCEYPNSYQFVFIKNTIQCMYMYAAQCDLLDSWWTTVTLCQIFRVNNNRSWYSYWGNVMKIVFTGSISLLSLLSLVLFAYGFPLSRPLSQHTIYEFQAANDLNYYYFLMTKIISINWFARLS